jgi:hypothetical protein
LVELGLKPKPASPKPKTLFKQKLHRKKPLISPGSHDLKTDRNKCISSFEPSNILYTRNSSLWRLRNLETWFKEQWSYEDPRYLKAYSIEI